ncbi:MAG TPA: hypothetical protein VM536_16005, partial [Chloroflexia bacterium]|nr:hypothetical protein [Chloroflexia bacterium]
MAQHTAPPGKARALAPLAAPLRGPYLYGLLVLAAVVLGAVAQQGGNYRWEMGTDRIEVYLVNFFGVEKAGTVPFRWTQPSARVQLLMAGSFDGRVRLRLNGDPWAGPPREASVQIGDGPLHQLPLEPGWHDYEVPFTRADLWPGDLRVRLRIPEAPIPAEQRAPSDTRHLGVPVEWVAVERMGIVLPSPALVALTSMLLAGVYILAVWLGVAPAMAAAIGAGLLAAWALVLLGDPRPALIAAPGLLAVGVTAFVLAPLLWALSGAMFRRAGIMPRRVEWQVLAGLFVAALVVKATGLLDPMFGPIDHYARLHRLMQFGDDPLYFLQHFLDYDKGQPYGGQLELGTTLPYSPLFYIVFAPLNWLVADPDMRLRAMSLVSCALDASEVFLLYYIARRGWGSALAGLWAGAVYVAFPLDNLPFSDGSYPGILATWLLMLSTAVLVTAYPHLDRWRVLIPTGLLLGLTVLSHPANALLLSPTILAFVGLVALLNRRRLGPAAALAGVALGFAFVAYYQFTVPRVFGEVLPRILEKLQTSGGVGQNPAVLGAPLLGGFWPQLAAHFQIWPVALGG